MTKLTMWAVGLWNWSIEGMSKHLELQARKALEHQKSLMGYSAGSLGDQNAKSNAVEADF